MLRGKVGVGLEQIARGGLGQLSRGADHLSLSEGVGAEGRGGTGPFLPIG